MLKNTFSVFSDEIKRVINIIRVEILEYGGVIVIVLPNRGAFGCRVQYPAEDQQLGKAVDIILDFCPAFVGSKKVTYTDLLKNPFQEEVAVQFRVPDAIGCVFPDCDMVCFGFANGKPGDRWPPGCFYEGLV